MNEQIEQADANVSTVDKKLIGIGGWLIWPAIAFVFGSIIRAVKLIPGFMMMGYGGIYILFFIVLFGILSFQIYAAILFFCKKSNAPRIIITFQVVNVVGMFLVAVLGETAKPYAVECGIGLVGAIISAAIWIPYFRLSKRVKATFTR